MALDVPALPDPNATIVIDPELLKLGPAAGFISTIPELQQLRDQLLADMESGVTDMSDEYIQGLLESTDWARNQLATRISREQEAASYDPAFFGEILQNLAGDIRQQFEQAGATIDDQTALDYANKFYYTSGRNEAGELEIFDADWLAEKMAGAVDFSKTQSVNGIPMYDLDGVAGLLADNIYKKAYAYGIDSSMSNAGFDGWFRNSLNNLMTGKMRPEEIDAYMRDEAISRYPGLANQMLGGLTLRDAADPYLKAIQDELELPDINLDDNLVQSVLNTTDENGNFKPMNLYDVKLKARSDPRWQYTQQAKEEYTNVAAMIAKDFGFM